MFDFFQFKTKYHRIFVVFSHVFNVARQSDVSGGYLCEVKLSKEGHW